MKMNIKRAIFYCVLILGFSMVPCYAEKFPDYDREDVDYIKADIDKDGIEEEIDISVASFEDKGIVCVLRVKDGDATTSWGFWVGLHSCNVSLIEISPQLEPYIAVDYGTGAHSYVVKLFRYKATSKDHYELKEVQEFFSSLPLIEIKDIDGDNVKDVVIMDRDYGASPTRDGYVNIWKYMDADKWECVSTHRTVTKEYMPKDWDKNVADIEVYKNNMKRFGMFDPEE